MIEKKHKISNKQKTMSSRRRSIKSVGVINRIVTLFGGESIAKKKIDVTTSEARNAILSANDVATTNCQKVNTEHLMKALLDNKFGLARVIFLNAGVDHERLIHLTDHYILQKKINLGGSSLKRLLNRGKKYCNLFGDSYLGVEHLLLAFTQDNRFGKKLFADVRLSYGALMDAIKAFRNEQTLTGQGEYNILDKYGQDLTAMATASKAAKPDRGRDGRMEVCIQNLLKGSTSIPLIIGEPDAVKTAILEGLAQRIVDKLVPEALVDCKLISLKTGNLIADAKADGGFESKLRAVLKEVADSNGRIILVIHDIHAIFGFGGNVVSMNTRVLLRHMVNRREIRCIGATCEYYYNKIAKDPVMGHRLVEVLMIQSSGMEPSEINTSGASNGCVFRPYSNMSMWNQNQARVKCKSENVREGVLHLEEVLNNYVGQIPDVRVVADAIGCWGLGFTGDPDSPIGSFVLLGPNSIEKTNLAKAVATCMSTCVSCTEETLVRLDMSKYTENHALSRLIGAPSGCDEYEGEHLTEIIHRMPCAVILVEGIEMAHPDVFNVFKRVLDEGRLRDAYGNIVNFNNTLILITSNVGSEVIPEREDVTREPTDMDYETVKENVMMAVNNVFNPKFIDRVDDFLVFRPLTREQNLNIVRLQLEKMVKKLSMGNMKIQFTDAVVNHLETAEYEDSNFEIMPVESVIKQHIVDELADRMLRGEFKGGDTIYVDIQVHGDDAHFPIEKLVFNKR